MSDELKWKFKHLPEDSVLTDPFDGSFFANNDDADNLVREAIQNSLDAVVDTNKPVTVKFTFSENKDRIIDNKKKYLSGLNKHLIHIGQIADFSPDIINQPLSYLVVEDFNTRGLQGDPNYFGLMKDESKEDRNDFYWFYRNRGRSGKTGEQRGRWGLGKRVFPQASSIKSFMGYTIRNQDKRRMLMGQCVLKTHEIRGKVFDSTGFYSIYENKPMPIENSDFLSDFCADFKLKRNNEPGFSAVIPYPNKFVDVSTVMRASIRHYFYAISNGNLVIEIYEGESRNKINKDNISEFIKEISWEDKNEEEHLYKMINFVKWVRQRDRSKDIILNKAGDNSAPSWNGDIFSDTKDIWQEVVNSYKEGERLAFTCPLYIKKKGKAKELSSFEVYIEFDSKLPKSYESFIREGLNINGIRTLKEPYVRGIVDITDKALSTLLGDAEDPAHKDWKENQEKLKNNYDRGTTTVRFVKNSLAKIIEELNFAGAVADKDLLADVEGLTYTVLDPIEPEKKVIKKRAKKKKTIEPGDVSDEPVIEIVAKQKKYTINRINEGFRIKNNEDTRSAPFQINVKCAYTTPVGDSFKNYENFDFRFVDSESGEVTPDCLLVEHEGTNVKTIREKPNRLVIEVLQDEFEVTVFGFDTNRDLDIVARAKEIVDET
ncbi:MAG: hypothetical protein ACJZ2J_01135 [Candidatus Poseidoniales archaeon]